MKKIVYILREHQTKKETTGIIIHRDEQNSIHTFTTLELPDLQNQKNISCIPKGTYTCLRTYSNHFEKYTYEILNVPGRAGIRIHSTNYYYELRGCIAIGRGLYDINNDKELDLIKSKEAIEQFETILQQQPFTLKIIEL